MGEFIVEVPLVVDSSTFNKARWALDFMDGLDRVLMAARRDRLSMRPPLPMGKYDWNIALLEAQYETLLKPPRRNHTQNHT